MLRVKGSERNEGVMKNIPRREEKKPEQSKSRGKCTKNIFAHRCDVSHLSEFSQHLPHPVGPLGEVRVDEGVDEEEREYEGKMREG